MKPINIIKRRSSCWEISGSSTELRYSDTDEDTKLFNTLADETWLSIIRQLAEQREVCACDFLACCDLAQPTVFHHLKVLREAGLVNTEKRGLWVYYTLNRDMLQAARAWLPRTVFVCSIYR